MLTQLCRLEEHRIVLPISITKHSYGNGGLGTATVADSSSLVEYRGLVDTGATRTVVCNNIIAEQKLMRTGHMQFSSMHGPETHTKYLASIGFWAERKNSPAGIDSISDEKSFFLHSQLIEPVNMNNNSNFDAIIGFDVLKHYDFSFDRHTQLFELRLS